MEGQNKGALRRFAKLATDAIDEINALNESRQAAIPKLKAGFKLIDEAIRDLAQKDAKSPHVLGLYKANIEISESIRVLMEVEV